MMHPLLDLRRNTSSRQKKFCDFCLNSLHPFSNYLFIICLLLLILPSPKGVIQTHRFNDFLAYLAKWRKSYWRLVTKICGCVVHVTKTNRLHLRGNYIHMRIYDEVECSITNVVCHGSMSWLNFIHSVL